MDAYIIVTNNGTVVSDYSERFEIDFVPGGLEEFYARLGEMLQSGFRLVSSPLPVNVPLIRSPVRSVIMQRAQQRFDAEGLRTLDYAKERTEALGINKDPRVLADLEMIDKDQLRCTVASLDAPLHVASLPREVVEEALHR